MKFIKLLLLTLFFSGFSYAQIGIGTTDPDPSSMLDITSDSQGLLVPRMTTAERDAIIDPAKSLLVFDTTENTYFYNDGDSTTPNWTPILSDGERRDNYVLVKDESDFPAPTGGTITLDENTYYEINGTISLSAPIDLNNAYVSGLDAGEDRLSSAGNVFQGNTGGSIRNITITGGGTAFNITGSGGVDSALLLIQNTIVNGMADVGTISNIGIYFTNILQFINNSSGITYSNIGNLLLNNQAWLDSNGGVYETFMGTFGFIEKVSGFSTVASGATGIDVSSNPTVGTGVIQATVFSGAGTYIDRYTTGSYTGYNFTNAWSVNAPGIPRESDDVATGNISLNASIASPANTTFTGTSTSSRRKLNGTTTSTNLFRFESSGNNRLIYKGDKKRFFQVNASLSFSTSFPTSPLVTTYALYIAKGSGTGSASVIQETRVYGRLTTSTSEVIAVPIVGTIELGTDDYIEIWAERVSGNGNIESASLNATIN